MERLARTLSLTCLALAAAQAEPAAYVLEPDADSRLELRVAKTGLMSGKVHVFRFERFSGAFEYHSDAPEASSVSLTIESASIVCEDDWLSEKNKAKVDREARGPMLAVDKHPQMRFRSTSFQTGSVEGEWTVQGELEIRSVARPVELAVTLEPSGGAFVVAGSAVVRLKDYGLKPPSAALGMIGTRNEMDFSFQLTARPR